MVSENRELMFCLFQPVTPLLECCLHSEEFTVANFIICSVRFSLREKNAQGYGLGGSPWPCESTAPMPVLEASTSTMNSRSGSGRCKIGAIVNLSLSDRNAAIAAEDQVRRWVHALIMDVMEAAIVLKLRMNRR